MKKPIEPPSYPIQIGIGIIITIMAAGIVGLWNVGMDVRDNVQSIKFTLPVMQKDVDELKQNDKLTIKRPEFDRYKDSVAKRIGQSLSDAKNKKQTEENYE